MYLTQKERRALTTVLGRLVVNKKYKTNIKEIYNELEKSNSLNLDEINNILHWVEASTVDDRFNLVKQYMKEKKYRKEYNERKKKK